jgi:hypothetical protein
LQTRDAILVEGDSQWKVIPAEKLWINDVRDTRSGSQDETRARFNGEQQVTGAILDLALKGDKPVVAFVRSGGEAMTGEGQPVLGQAEGPYNAVAENLMSHNFQVIEKDFGAEPNPEEPDSAVSDKQVNDKNTVWVVMDLPGGGGGPMGGGSPPPTNMIQHIGEHLRAGGSVLVCAEAMSDDLHDALNDWGIDLKPSVIAMHKHVDTQSDSDDIINQALQIPYLFRITDYGNADFLKPIQSLPGIFPPLAIVETHPVAGKTLTPILPVPGAPDFPDCWGSVTGQAIMEGTAQAVFHPDADTKAPIFGGAVSEQSGGGRLIVIGSWQFATSRLVEMHDPHNFAVLLPGNGEIFADSVYWLARKPEMIALSASAEDVSRIADMSSATKTTWWIVILGMLPAAVIASGAMVYTSRRS